MIDIIKAVRDKSSQRGSHLLVLMMLAERANERGQAWPSIDTIAHDCRLGYRRVMTIIGELKESGEIEVQEGKSEFGTNIYTFRIDRMSRQGLPARTRRHPVHPLKVGEQFRGTQTAPNPPVSVREEKDKIQIHSQRENSLRDSEIRIERAASPRVPKHPADPLMRAASAPSKGDKGGGPLFGGEEPKADPPKVKPPDDAILVRDEFVRQYEAQYPVTPAWGPAEAQAAKRAMAMVRQACEKRKGAEPAAVLRQCVSKFLGDRDRFLDTNSHRFTLLAARLPGYLADVLKLGGRSKVVLPEGTW